MFQRIESKYWGVIENLQTLTHILHFVSRAWYHFRMSNTWTFHEILFRPWSSREARIDVDPDNQRVTISGKEDAGWAGGQLEMWTCNGQPEIPYPISDVIQLGGYQFSRIGWKHISSHIHKCPYIVYIGCMWKCKRKNVGNGFSSLMAADLGPLALGYCNDVLTCTVDIWILSIKIALSRLPFTRRIV
jgi:hypothetical protein